MRTYETTFIINPQADDATLDKQVSLITDLIKGNGGNILCENRIGTRRLAYSIAGLSQGYYTQLFFDAPQEALPVLDRFFKLEEQYIRFMTVSFEGPVPTLEDLNRPARDDDRDERNERSNRRNNDDDDSDDDDDDDRRPHRRHSGRREERPREAASDARPAREEAPKPAAAPAKEKPAEVKPAPAPHDDDIL